MSAATAKGLASVAEGRPLRCLPTDLPMCLAAATLRLLWFYLEHVRDEFIDVTRQNLLLFHSHDLFKKALTNLHLLKLY